MRLSICIVTKLTQNKFFTCVESIKKHTNPNTLGNMEIRICYTGSDPNDIKEIQDKMQYLGISFSVAQMGYNFAKNNNFLVMNGSESEYVLFLNDDVEIVDDSISYCLEQIDSNEDVGTVGIKLLYPDGRIQHAGQFVAYDKEGKFLGVGHIGYKQPDIPFGQDCFTFGNTGAFLMCRRKDFIEAGMFNEGYVHCFEDVELNGKMLLMGKKNLTCLSRSAIHHESITRKLEMSRDDIDRIANFFNENGHLLRSKILK